MLSFLDIPVPEIQVWETLGEEQRILAIAVLARLIAQATVERQRSEKNHDR
jgi:hypothetical protein